MTRDHLTQDLEASLYLAEHDFADEMRGETPPSKVRFLAFWIFTTIFCVLTLLAVVAAGLRMVGAE